PAGPEDGEIGGDPRGVKDAAGGLLIEVHVEQCGVTMDVATDCGVEMAGPHGLGADKGGPEGVKPGGDGAVARETLAAEGVGEALDLGAEALAVLLAAQSHDDGEQGDRGGDIPEAEYKEDAAQDDGEEEAEAAVADLLLATLL